MLWTILCCPCFLKAEKSKPLKSCHADTPSSPAHEAHAKCASKNGPCLATEERLFQETNGTDFQNQFRFSTDAICQQYSSLRKWEENSGQYGISAQAATVSIETSPRPLITKLEVSDTLCINQLNKSFDEKTRQLSSDPNSSLRKSYNCHSPRSPSRARTKSAPSSRTLKLIDIASPRRGSGTLCKKVDSGEFWRPNLRIGSTAQIALIATPSFKSSANPKEEMLWGDCFVVEESYQGPHICWPLSKANVLEVVAHIEARPNTRIHPKYVAQLLGRSVSRLKQELTESVCEMSIPLCSETGEQGKLIVCGDLHGQLKDFLHILSKNGIPSHRTAYLVNGDVVDRGEHSCEILIILLLFKLLYPSSVVINRGSHENIELNKKSLVEGGGFFDEVMGKFARWPGDEAMFYMFQRLFELLPLATVVDGSVFVVHGGLFRKSDTLLDDVRKAEWRGQCPSIVADPDQCIMFDALWSDPRDEDGIGYSDLRSNCISFGPDVTSLFLRKNGLSLVVRSHQLPENNRGFDVRHGGRLVTLFSASDYCGSTGNTGAVLVLHRDLTYFIEEHLLWSDEYPANS